MTIRLKNSCENIVYLREASIDDCVRIFNWRNDTATRMNSMNTKPISWEEHYRWYSMLMSSCRSRWYIFTDGSVDYGVIRFDVYEVCKTAEINYSIDAKYRNRGLGKKIVALGIIKILEDVPALENVTALVKNNNIASTRIFNSLGFICVEDSGRKGAVVFTADRKQMEMLCLMQMIT